MDKISLIILILFLTNWTFEDLEILKFKAWLEHGLKIAFSQLVWTHWTSSVNN